MRSVAVVALAAALVGFMQPADAQTSRYRGYRTSTAPAPAQPEYPRYQERGYPMYTQPPGQTGIIRWNTPNADGNFGAPSGGGSGSP